MRPSWSTAAATWTSLWLSTPTVTRRWGCGMLAMSSLPCRVAAGRHAPAGPRTALRWGLAPGSYQVTGSGWWCREAPGGLVDRSPRRQSKDAGGIAGQASPGHLPAHLRFRPPPATSAERSFRGRQLPNGCSLLTLLASLVPSLQGRSSPVPILAVVSGVAADDAGRLDPGRAGHAGQCGGVRPARWWPRAGGIPAGAAGGAGGVRHARDRGRRHGWAASWRGLAGAVACPLAWPGDAAAGRPGPVRPVAVAHLAGHRGGAGVALPPGCEAGGAGGLRRWFLAQRAGCQPALQQADPGAGHRLPPGRSRPPRPAGGLPAADHDPGP